MFSGVLLLAGLGAPVGRLDLDRRETRPLFLAAAAAGAGALLAAIVDATLVRYQPGIYNSCLTRQAPVQRRLTEDTFAGLRFVRNRMG